MFTLGWVLTPELVFHLKDKRCFMGEVKARRWLVRPWKEKVIVFSALPACVWRWKTLSFLCFRLGGTVFHFHNICNYLVNVCISVCGHSVFTFQWASMAFQPLALWSFHFLLPTTQQHTRMNPEMFRNAEASRWSMGLEEAPHHYAVIQTWHHGILDPWDVAFIC